MRVRSAQEKATLVAEYLGVQHGRKAGWLAERGISGKSISRWRKAYFYGDLELELVPRDTSSMSVSEGARIKQLEVQLASERAARAAEQARHGEDVDRLNRINDALGKAIGLLHDRAGEREPTDES